MKNKIVLSLIISVILFNLNLIAGPTKKPDFEKLPKYEDLLDKIKKGITDINFYDLRMSYTQTKNYKSTNTSLDSLRKKMIKELKGKDYREAIKFADSILDQEFVDMYSHYVCYYAYTALGDSVTASWHEFMMDRLLNSIVESGEGNSKESAMLIINSNEEYFFIYIYKLDVKSKSFTDYNGDPIDILKATDPETKEPFELYFNTSLILNH